MHKLIVRITDKEFPLLNRVSGTPHQKPKSSEAAKVSSSPARGEGSLVDAECIIVPAELITDDFKTDKIVLVEGENAVEVCKEHNLDGVVIDLSKSEKIKAEVKALRQQLGNKVLGIIVRNRRHEAMLASEEEPDLVIFRAWKDGAEKSKELVEWYNDVFLIQSAVSLEEDGIDVADWKVDMVIRKP